MTAGRFAALCLLAFASGCSPGASEGPKTPGRLPPSELRELPSRPPLAAVVREGDPRAAVTFAVLTAGLREDVRLPVALSAVVEERLRAQHVADVSIHATWDGYEVAALLPVSGDAASLVRALRDALLVPIAASDVTAATAKLAMLASRPVDDAALLEVSRCREEPAAAGEVPSVDAATLERWRAAADGLGRIVVGATGGEKDVESLASAILAQPAWPVVTRAGIAEPPRPVPFVAYDVPAARASRTSVTVVVHTPSAGQAADAAKALGANDGALAQRLRALDSTATLHDVTATAHPDGGCLAVRLDVPRSDRRPDADSDARLALLASTLRQETLLAATGGGDALSAIHRAALATDPREASALAAWWALVDIAAPGGAPYAMLLVGLPGSGSETTATRAKALGAAIDRAEASLETHVLDARVRVERGQGGMWLLLASTCGSMPEGEADAGLSALTIASLAVAAQGHGAGNDVTDWITTDGAGLVLHATRSAGESPTAFARRAAETLGAAFAAAVADDATVARASEALTASTDDDDARGFATLSLALTPGHPSWSYPLATRRGFESFGAESVLGRAGALRRGPVRLAILADEDASEAATAVASLDRWLPRTPGVRTCPVQTPPLAAKPGTYSAPSSATPSAWLALPLAADARAAATLLAAALDGADGLLAHALGSGLATSWGARVVGPHDAPALAIHVVASNDTLDAAVAQIRALLDRVRQGAFVEDDLTRAVSHLREAALERALDPRERLAALWRGDAPVPTLSLDAIHALAARDLKDDALIIVASRPPPAKISP